MNTNEILKIYRSWIGNWCEIEIPHPLGGNHNNVFISAKVISFAYSKKYTSNALFIEGHQIEEIPEKDIIAVTVTSRG